MPRHPLPQSLGVSFLVCLSAVVAHIVVQFMVALTAYAHQVGKGKGQLSAFLFGLSTLHFADVVHRVGRPDIPLAGTHLAQRIHGELGSAHLPPLLAVHQLNV